MPFEHAAVCAVGQQPRQGKQRASAAPIAARQDGERRRARRVKAAVLAGLLLGRSEAT